jgi:hypothetical protein
MFGLIEAVDLDKLVSVMCETIVHGNDIHTNISRVCVLLANIYKCQDTDKRHFTLLINVLCKNSTGVYTLINMTKYLDTIMSIKSVRDKIQSK